MTSRDATGDTSSNGRDVQAIDIIDPSQLEVVSITLAPTDPIITVDPASAPHPTQAFMVTGQRRDGTMATGLAALWSLVPAGSGAVDPNLVGAINETTGVFTASGSAGGEIRVQAAVATQSGMVMASTSLTVLIHATVLVNGAPPDVMSHFAGAAMTDPARQADVAYPLDQSVMPQNVYPADIQWNNGAAGDDFRITMRKPHANVIAYLHAESGFTNDYLVEQTVWRQLAQTDVGDSMSITVDRYEAATSQVITSPPVNMRFANGAVAGTIYYWDIAAGQARRIDDGTATRTTPIPTPPTSPDDASNCMGCHAVSRDGRYFAGRLGGAGAFALSDQRGGAMVVRVVQPRQHAARHRQLHHGADAAPSGPRSDERHGRHAEHRTRHTAFVVARRTHDRVRSGARGHVGRGVLGRTDLDSPGHRPRCLRVTDDAARRRVARSAARDRRGRQLSFVDA